MAPDSRANGVHVKRGPKSAEEKQKRIHRAYKEKRSTKEKQWR